jgi:hypothetical protein
MNIESDHLSSINDGYVDGMEDEKGIAAPLNPEAEGVAGIDIKFYIGARTASGHEFDPQQYKFSPERSRSFPTLAECRARIREIYSESEKYAGPPLPDEHLTPVAVQTIFYSK